MDVTQAALADDALDVLAGLVEVLPNFQHRGTVGAHRRVLVGVVTLGDDDGARHRLALTGHGNRLPVITGARGEDPAPFVAAQAGDQVEAAADLERVRRVVVLVFDEQVEAGRLIQQRVLQERCRAQRPVHDPACGIDVAERKGHG